MQVPADELLLDDELELLDDDEEDELDDVPVVVELLLLDPSLPQAATTEAVPAESRKPSARRRPSA
jgi:hypothetical protein